jgi:hypothetical protein
MMTPSPLSRQKSGLYLVHSLTNLPCGSERDRLYQYQGLSHDRGDGRIGTGGPEISRPPDLVIESGEGYGYIII